MFFRPCFLVVDREFAGSISTRKLVIETAKFNVITAYSFEEAVATMERFPLVHGVVVNAGKDEQAVDFLRMVKVTYPGVKRVLTGSAQGAEEVSDTVVESYAPDHLLTALRKLFPEKAAQANAIEARLTENDDTVSATGS